MRVYGGMQTSITHVAPVFGPLGLVRVLLCFLTFNTLLLLVVVAEIRCNYFAGCDN